MHYKLGLKGETKNNKSLIKNQGKKIIRINFKS